MEKTNQGQSILDLVDGYVIPFQRKPFQSKFLNKSKTTKTDGQGSSGYVEEESNKTSQYSKEGILKQFVPCREEGWGQRPAIHLKHLNVLYHTITSK